MHIAVRCEDVLASSASDADVLRKELEILEPGIQRQCDGIRMDDVPRAHTAIEIRELPADLVEQERPVRGRRPLDEDKLVRETTRGELLMIELERTEEPGGKITTVAVIASSENDAEKRVSAIQAGWELTGSDWGNGFVALFGNRGPRSRIEDIRGALEDIELGVNHHQLLACHDQRMLGFDKTLA